MMWPFRRRQTSPDLSVELARSRRLAASYDRDAGSWSDDQVIDFRAAFAIGKAQGLPRGAAGISSDDIARLKAFGAPGGNPVTLGELLWVEARLRRHRRWSWLRSIGFAG